MIVLGIESSCDETGVALVAYDGTAIPALRAHALHSQADMHRAYGGVVPELASRDHIRRVLPLVQQVLSQTGAALGRPVLGVHHLEGHLLSPFLSNDPPQFPFVALLVSGGHTQLMRVDGVGDYTLLGETLDDAAGEAFDKSAKVLGLGYPGGPALSALAAQGRADGFALPRPLLHSGGLDFSFAGLKTAVWTQHRKLGMQPSQQALADLAASTQAAIVDVLVHKCARALRDTGLQRLVVAGGVGANSLLRERLSALASKQRFRVHYPELALCTDNGAMIALAAAMRVQRNLATPSRDYAFDVAPRWPLEQISNLPARAAGAR